MFSRKQPLLIDRRWPGGAPVQKTHLAIQAARLRVRGHLRVAAAAAALAFLASTVHAQSISLTANPNPIIVPAGTTSGVTTISFNAPGYPNAQVRVGSATGTELGCCESGSAVTGNWVTDGMNFYLVDGNTGNVLQTTTVYLSNPTISASPNPIIVPAGATSGVTTISFNAPGYPNAQVRVGSATGGELGCCGSGTAVTGNWVTNGMNFYLVDENTGNVLQTTTVYLGNASLSASPNPIVVPAGTTAGVTTISFNAPGYSNTQVRVGSPTGDWMLCCESSGSGLTGDWVTNGMNFYLVDANTGNVLQSLTVQLQAGPITLTATPNPILVPPGATVGTTAISYNAPGYPNAQVRPVSPTGAWMLCCESSGSGETGAWVTNGLPFFLVDASTGNTLQTLTVNLQQGALTVGGYLNPASPAKEYIYGNGQVVAIEHMQ